MCAENYLCARKISKICFCICPSKNKNIKKLEVFSEHLKIYCEIIYMLEVLKSLCAKCFLICALLFKNVYARTQAHSVEETLLIKGKPSTYKWILQRVIKKSSLRVGRKGKPFLKGPESI